MRSNTQINKHLKQKNKTRSMKLEKSTYSFQRGELIIFDPTLKLNIKETYSTLYLPLDLESSLALDKGLIVKKANEGQIIEAYFEHDEKLQGQHKSFYLDGTLKSECFYKDNKLIGFSKFYSKNGTLLSRSWYHNDQKSGLCEQFYLNSELYSEEKYICNQLQGEQKYYYKNGQLKTSMHFDMGKQIKTAKLYYENGNLKREVSFNDGVKCGLDIQYYPNKQKAEEAYYRGTLKEKKYTKWHPNGEISHEIIYHIPPKLYDIKIYNEDGILIKSGDYNESDQSYIQRSYSNGVIELELKGKWKNNEIVLDLQDELFK